MRRDWKKYNTQLVKRGQTHNHNTSKQKSFVKELFKQTGISIDLPNFKTIHYRHSREDFHLDHLPDNTKNIPQDFVIVLDSTSIKLTNRGKWLSKKLHVA